VDLYIQQNTNNYQLDHDRLDKHIEFEGLIFLYSILVRYFDRCQFDRYHHRINHRNVVDSFVEDMYVYQNREDNFLDTNIHTIHEYFDNNDRRQLVLDIRLYLRKCLLFHSFDNLADKHNVDLDSFHRFDVRQDMYRRLNMFDALEYRTMDIDHHHLRNLRNGIDIFDGIRDFLVDIDLLTYNDRIISR